LVTDTVTSGINKSYKELVLDTKNGYGYFKRDKLGYKNNIKNFHWVWQFIQTLRLSDKVSVKAKVTMNYLLSHCRYKCWENII
jgi:hypothetical protein